MPSELNPAALHRASKAIAAAGGPEWPEWCNCATECVEAHVDEVWSPLKEWCYCPPAVRAAVVWYAGEVRAWLAEAGHDARRRDNPEDYCGDQSSVFVYPNEDGPGCFWQYSAWRGLNGKVRGVLRAPTELALSMGIIVAVTSMLERGDDEVEQRDCDAAAALITAVGEQVEETKENGDD